jgi:YrbI family 3-deoxy-D-manno-octulosonate 8-phosphate phosphatase
MMNIKLVITDIDGVWTDGGMYYDKQGNELKKFNTSDSAGVAFLRAIKLPVAIITGEDTEIVRHRAEKLKIDHLFIAKRNKLKTATALVKGMGISLKEVAFLGDDINDIPLLKEAGLSAVPANAKPYVRKHAGWVLKSRGGEGAFREFVERILRKNKLFHKALDAYLDEIKEEEG